jgi:hypothetical protein
VDRQSFQAAVTRSRSVTSIGYEQRDYDRILAIP